MRFPRFSLRALFAFMTLMCVVYAFPQVMFYVFLVSCATIVILAWVLCALATVVLPVRIALNTIKRHRPKEHREIVADRWPVAWLGDARREKQAGLQEHDG